MNKALYRFWFVFLICLIGCITENKAQSSTKNWGMRFGLNAVSIANYKVYQGDEMLENSSFTNKNGYLLTAFARFNINRIFLQPELGWNNYRRTCSFSLLIDNDNNYYYPTDLDINFKTLNTNFLVGYNIVLDTPFLFGAFVGSSFIGTYNTDFSINPENRISHTGLFLNYTGFLGFSINISKIYFDLRYEMSLPNANLDLKEIPEFPDIYQDITIKKTESILSFSFGIMF